MFVGARPTVAQTTMTSADTEYSYTFPTGTAKMELKLEDLNALLKVSYVEGESGTDYITVPYGASYVEGDAKLSGVTIYVQSPSASQVLQVKSWIR